MTALPADLVEAVRRRLATSGAAPTTSAIAAALRAERRAPTGDTALLDMAARLHAELVGAGPLTGLLSDPDVTDVLVNGPDDVWIDRGDGLHRVTSPIGHENVLRRLAQRLAAACGRRLDDAQPWVDARLPGGGARVHAVLPPIAVGGVYLSLRTVRPQPITLDALTVPPDGRRLLRALIDARLAFLVTGGTGSGKTTVLNALLGAVPATERIVVVEDATELRPAHPHVVSLESRTPNADGAGEVTMRQLVRQALRMRPDRIVVGECRGAEVVDLLAALNTGHDGGAGTLHANSPADVPARLEALAALGGLAPAALHSQLAAALRALVHVTRTPAGRVVAEICLIDGADVRTAWRYDGGFAPGAGELRELLAARGVQW